MHLYSGIRAQAEDLVAKIKEMVSLPLLLTYCLYHLYLLIIARCDG